MTDTFSHIRDQPVLQGLLRWQGGWVAAGNQLFTIDVHKKSAAPLEHSGLDAVLDVAEASATALVFGTKGQQAKLVVTNSSVPEVEIPLPVEVLSDPSRWRLAAAGEKVVLISNNLTFSCKVPDYKWSPVRMSQKLMSQELWRAKDRANLLKSILICDAQVFVAVDQGEWGGGLWSVELTTGTVSLVEKDSNPATGLALDDKGRVWATWGLAHKMIRQGTLRVLEGDNWRLVSRTDNLDKTRQKNWSLPSTSFNSVTVEQGRIFVLTGTLGVVELVNGSWQQRAIGWSDHQYVTALAMQDDMALIATYNAGVVVWNLCSGEMGALRLRPA